jgi:hypothetical protein
MPATQILTWQLKKDRKNIKMPANGAQQTELYPHLQDEKQGYSPPVTAQV